ncbi:MacA family efflux pump subunit [Acinetobacter qingfengensis]|uniref:MacA family efflux pump subunit n=1 Tax=Acinetobacter qingfengensis TaxID=1262585 RepID=A0A1E7RDX5_9GAMM|nr:MacA family efflux pump subunit [Acinetobacter qingfengensis]KAA8734526.1 MacA family efflux pump subunit [Acinetobacter qingfengensis]OEY97564.1 MacA family efflux pump subunit [Acinetobacter qingfengensis]
MLSRSKIIKIVVGIIVLILIAFGAWSYLKPKQTAPDYITAEVTQGDLQNTVLATGTLDATKIISVGAQVSGQVKKMYVELGQEVKKGDPIAQIDSTTQENSLKTAEASITNLEAQRLQQIANLNQVQQEYQRQKQMYAQDATSRADYESALANYQTAQAQIKAIDAQIQSAKVTRDTATTNVGYTHIVAPMDGTVVAIVTEEGQTVNANQSTPTIVKLAKLDTMTIKAEISEADVMKVEKGQTVYFTTLGDSNTKHYASLRQVEPAPDSITDDDDSSDSSTAIYYNALFDVPNADGKLRIDMTANVTIILQDAKNALIIPATAISTHNNSTSSTQVNSASAPAAQARTGSNSARSPLGRLELTEQEQAQIKSGQASLAMVRVLQADGTARPQQILVGINNRVNAQVLKGLKKGDKVIVADGSDTSNDSSKRSTRKNNSGPPPMGM